MFCSESEFSKVFRISESEFWKSHLIPLPSEYGSHSKLSDRLPIVDLLLLNENAGL